MNIHGDTDHIISFSDIVDSLINKSITVYLSNGSTIFGKLSEYNWLILHILGQFGDVYIPIQHVVAILHNNDPILHNNDPILEKNDSE